MARKYIIGTILAIVLAASIGWLFIMRSPASTATTDASLPAGITVTQDPFFGQSPVRDGLRRYQNLLFRFSLYLPEGLQLQEYSETNTTTLVFTDPVTKYGFQIFVVPYTGNQISEERFKMDIPSGVREQETAIVIDGTTATMFYSKNAAFGDTREVWFIKNGFLYEVTTYKQLDEWLASIMQTWKFL